MKGKMMTETNDKLLDGTAGIADHFFPAESDEDRKKNQRMIQHWIDSHDMPVSRVGRRIYGKVAAIREWLDKR